MINSAIANAGLMGVMNLEILIYQDYDSRSAKSDKFYFF